MASLAWFGTIGGERPFVQENVSIDSELAGKVTGVGFPGSRSHCIRYQAMGNVVQAPNLIQQNEEFPRDLGASVLT